MDEFNQFLRSYIAPREKTELLVFAEENKIPIINPEVEQFLRVILSVLKPNRILEIGAAIGYSASFFLEATGADVTTIEIDGEKCEIALQFLKRITNNEKRITIEEFAGANSIVGAHRVRPRATGTVAPTGAIRIIHGDAWEVLPTLNEQYDFIFLDSSKSHYHEYLEDLVRLLATGGMLVCDNVLFKGKVITPEYPEKKHRTTVRHLREFLKMISEHPKLTTSILPIGDGISVSIKA
ncbi:MAG: O-methyltransferase [Oscillospiraceae bacterium]|nr:O-methyltransferase [Oscillospiraceae bacterium]